VHLAVDCSVDHFVKQQGRDIDGKAKKACPRTVQLYNTGTSREFEKRGIMMEFLGRK
jgi:hypothetical protein